MTIFATAMLAFLAALMVPVALILGLMAVESFDIMWNSAPDEGMGRLIDRWLYLMFCVLCAAIWVIPAYLVYLAVAVWL